MLPKTAASQAPIDSRLPPRVTFERGDRKLPLRMPAAPQLRSRRTRRWLAGPAALVVFLAIAWPSSRYRAYPLYVVHLAAEKAGLLTTGSLHASQILGHYFPGAPPAVRFGIDAFGGAATYTPALIAALLVGSRLARSHETRCGRCGEILRGLHTPQCPHCGNPM